jgi:hypothetical protein
LQDAGGPQSISLIFFARTSYGCWLNTPGSGQFGGRAFVHELTSDSYGEAETKSIADIVDFVKAGLKPQLVTTPITYNLRLQSKSTISFRRS